jgi:hypothetical protein
LARFGVHRKAPETALSPGVAGATTGFPLEKIL